MERKPKSIKPLFTSTEALPVIEEQKPQSTDTNSFNTGIVTEVEHEFYQVSNAKTIKEKVPVLEHNKCYAFMTFGEWALKHAVFHVAKLIGPCDVIATTFGLGAGSARGIVEGLRKGIFTSFQFLYDRKVREYREEAHFMCLNNFTVKVASIHAKVCVLKNEHWAVLITGSANWSDTNAKIEFLEITVHRAKAEFFYDLLQRSIKAQASLPIEILKEIQNDL